MICETCGERLPLRVLQSEAGWYVGRACRCGPHSRESDDFATEIAASESPLLSLEGSHLELVLDHRMAVTQLEEAARELTTVLSNLPTTHRKRTARALAIVQNVIRVLK